MAISPDQTDLAEFEFDRKCDEVESKIDEILMRSYKGEDKFCIEFGRLGNPQPQVIDALRLRYKSAGWADIKIKIYGKCCWDLVLFRRRTFLGFSMGS